MGLISTRTFLGSRMYEWGNRLREIVRERQKESIVKFGVIYSIVQSVSL